MMPRDALTDRMRDKLWQDPDPDLFWLRGEELPHGHGYQEAGDEGP